MKRFGLFLLVTMAAAIFTSCNDSDGDYPRLSAFASVKPLEITISMSFSTMARRCTRATKAA